MSVDGEYQAWCLGAKVGDAKSSEPEAWQEVHRVGMVLFSEDRKRRRAFEDICQICRVVPLSSIPESATEGPITVVRSTTEARAFLYR